MLKNTFVAMIDSSIALNEKEVIALQLIDKNRYEKEFSNVSYPPRTKQAREMAQKVAKIIDNLGIGKEIFRTVTVFVHENGSVSIGLSGRSKNDDYQKNVKLLQEYLNNLKDGHDYTVATQSIPIDHLVQVNKKGACPKGNCAEPKAAYAAHSNSSPITGYDTVWRGNDDNNYPFTGENEGEELEDSEYEQMDPCKTCGHIGNIKVYMEFARAGSEPKPK